MIASPDAPAHPWRRRLRLAAFLLTFLPLTLTLIPVQALAVRFGWRLASRLPLAYHRLVCRLLGVRIAEDGAPARERPLLVVSNHMSWLDITVISTALPLSFIAKSEVATWPFFGTLARLQRTIFIDRTRRSAAAVANREIAARLGGGDAIVLFAEGTTSDGSRVLPFRSALLGAARDAVAEAGHTTHVVVQPLTVAYPRRGGLPLGRADRPDVAWYGDMDLLPHLADIVAGPPLDAVLVWGEPIPFDAGTDRKTVTRIVETRIRGDLARVLTGRQPA